MNTWQSIRCTLTDNETELLYIVPCPTFYWDLDYTAFVQWACLQLLQRLCTCIYYSNVKSLVTVNLLLCGQPVADLMGYNNRTVVESILTVELTLFQSGKKLTHWKLRKFFQCKKFKLTDNSLGSFAAKILTTQLTTNSSNWHESQYTMW